MDNINNGREINEYQTKLAGEAIIWLIQRGQIINVDFNITNAIEKADALAYQIEVNEYNRDSKVIAGWKWMAGKDHTFQNPQVILGLIDKG